MKRVALILIGLVLVSAFVLGTGLLAAPAQAQGSVGMRLDPMEVEVDEEEDDFIVKIVVTVPEGAAVDFATASIDFEPNKMKVEAIIPGSVLSEEWLSEFDNDAGTIDYHGAAGIDDPDATDDFILATVKFEAEEATSGSPLRLVNIFPNRQGNRQTVAILDAVSVLDASAVYDSVVVIPGKEPPDTPTPSPTPTPTPSMTPTVIPTETPIETPAGNATPVIDIEIVALPEEDWPEPPEGKFIVVAFDYGPEGTVFDPPQKLTMAYDQALVPEGALEEDLVMAWYDSERGEWEILPVVEVDTENNVIIAEVAHLTVFAILGEFAVEETPTPVVVTETPEMTPTPTETVTPAPTATPVPEPGDGMPTWIVIVLVIGAIMVGALVYMLLRRR